MEKEFIPYEEALVLKELGFNRRTLAQYNTRQGNEWILTLDFSGEGQYPKGSSACIAPTFSQAFRWFREKYNMNAIVSYYGKNQYFIELLDYKGNQLVQVEEIEDNTFWTYEEAELECLKKLIEIVKTKETC